MHPACPAQTFPYTPDKGSAECPATEEVEIVLTLEGKGFHSNLQYAQQSLHNSLPQRLLGCLGVEGPYKWKASARAPVATGAALMHHELSVRLLETAS
jgi:hypothetical protein